MGDSNLNLLGLASGTYEAEDPYFDIAVGNNDLTRITITPADDETTLLAKLQAVPGLAAQYGAGGELILRPGEDPLNPNFGGDIRVVSGPFTASAAGANAVFGPGTIADGVNVLSAVFGSFNAGPPVQDVSLESRAADDSSFRDLLQDQLLNESGVNIDEELANLIVVQTAYAASARVIGVVDELFQELLATVA